MKLKRKVYIETLGFCIAYFILGYLLIKEDPLLIKGKFNCLIFVLSVLTLYHGLTAGLISLLFFGVIMYFTYSPMPLDSFFWLLLLTFIFGGFHILWKRKINRLNEENSYFKERLEDLGKEMFILKASYEQIERNYIFKPFSIRSSLQELRQMLIKNGDSVFAEFMEFLGKITGIESASLYLKKNGTPVEVAKIGDGVCLDKDDPLIKLSDEKESSVFVSVAETESDSNYQAVIPIFGNYKEIKGYLLIKSIPFMQLNRDNLLIMSVLTSYFYSEFEIKDKINRILDKFPRFDSTFCKELLRLLHLQKRFGVESSIIKLCVEDKYMYKVITTFIEGHLRGMDLATRYQQKNDYWFFVLLPFTDYANAYECLIRIIRDVEVIFGRDSIKKIHYRVLPVVAKDEIELLNRVIES